MTVSTSTRETPSLTAIEACNALKAEHFTPIPEEIALWRFREVLTRLGAELGLSGGAALYGIDMLGFLTEADWRGDGRPVTYHSIRSYARKVGKSERTICEYERQLIAAGLAHRTIKHARRHGGAGNEARRTGLDWRCFGTRLPELLDRLAARDAQEAQRRELEARLRAARRVAMGLMQAVIERAGQGVATQLAAEYAALDVSRLRGSWDAEALEERLRGLEAFQRRLEAQISGDKRSFVHKNADQSEETGGLIDNTTHSQHPKDVRNDTEQPIPIKETKHHNRRQPLTHGNRCSDRRYRAVPDPKPSPKQLSRVSKPAGQGAAMPLARIWEAAPLSWHTLLGEIDISWPALVEIAAHKAPQLDVSPYAWKRAIQVLGPADAAMALLVLDVNQNHPVRPVMSVGAALVGMIRRAEQGQFNLTPSIYGVIARQEGRGQRQAAPEGSAAINCG